MYSLNNSYEDAYGDLVEKLELLFLEEDYSDQRSFSSTPSSDMETTPSYFYPFNQSMENEMHRLFPEYRPGNLSPSWTWESSSLASSFKSESSISDVFEKSHTWRESDFLQKNKKVAKKAEKKTKKMESLMIECVFCKNNNRPEQIYKGHRAKDENGITTCPLLRKHVCPRCKGTGDQAHTIRYCPVRKIFKTLL